MPNYLETPCEGMCDRLGYPCQREKFFVDAAAERFAKPKQFKQTTNYGKTDETEWFFWGLEIPEDQQGLAFADIATHSDYLVHENGEILPYWLKEYPCHAGCDITVCFACKKAHNKNAYDDNGICMIYEQEEAKKKADAVARKKRLGSGKSSTWANTKGKYAKPAQTAQKSLPLMAGVDTAIKESLDQPDDELPEEQIEVKDDTDNTGEGAKAT